MIGRTVRSRSRIAALATILALITVSACADQAVVKVWNYNVHDKKYLQKMFKAFNQNNPDIKIEYTSIGINTYPQVLEAAEVAKEMPDLFIFGSGSKLTLPYLRERNLISR